MTTKADTRKLKQTAKPSLMSTAGAWIAGRFGAKPKSRVKVGKRPTVVGRLGDEKRPINIGGIIARIALTALTAQIFIMVTPRTGAVTRVLEQAAGIDSSCGLREWTGNPVVDKHWPDIRRWCPVIMDASAAYNFDPALLAVLMLQESGGQPEVISHSGAVGLLQVMPRDGIAAGFQCRAGPCFANRPSIDELKDPEFNVDYGAKLLAANVQRTGSLREALKSYGPSNVGYSYADGILRIYETIK